MSRSMDTGSDYITAGFILAAMVAGGPHMAKALWAIEGRVYREPEWLFTAQTVCFVFCVLGANLATAKALLADGFRRVRWILAPAILLTFATIIAFVSIPKAADLEGISISVASSPAWIAEHWHICLYVATPWIAMELALFCGAVAVGVARANGRSLIEAEHERDEAQIRLSKIEARLSQESRPSPAQKTGPSSTSSTDRVDELMALLRTLEGPVSVNDLAARLELSISTVRRDLGPLIESGAARCLRESTPYRYEAVRDA